MEKVRRAIILAAGFGSRMRMLTRETPKPLLRVRGVPMIETTIAGLHQNGIYEIIIVVGYKKECFQYLTEKYPGVRLVENPYYQTYNNLSSIYCVREWLGNAMIVEGDQYFASANPLTTEFVHSEYNAYYSEKKLPEWTADVDEADRIVNCEINGKENAWVLYGVSRWTAEDGRRLGRYVAAEFENHNTKIYWDNVPIYLYPGEFSLYIRRTDPSDRIELDSVEELAAFDPAYEKYIGVTE